MSKKRSVVRSLKTQDEYDLEVECRTLILKAHYLQEASLEETVHTLCVVLGYSNERAKEIVLSNNETYEREQDDVDVKKRWTRQMALEAFFMRKRYGKNKRG